MSRLLRTLRRVREDERGLSLTELLITSLLTMVVMALIGSFFIETARLTTVAAQSRETTGVAANIANSLTSVVRMATTLAKSSSEIPDPAIVAGTRSSLTIYSYTNTSATDPAPVRVTFTLDATGKLTETRCTGTSSSGFWSFSSCASTSTRTLGQGVLAPTGTSDQLFTYRDGSGTPMLIGTGSLSAAQRADVSSILIQVRVKAPGSNVDPVVVTNTVVLRNLGLETSE
jgi:Tfp pilus assembly protein PilW